MGWSHDFRLAFRTLAKRPGFTAIALLTLVLGIGANTAIFTVVNAVLLRPLAYHEPDRLLRIWETNEQQNKPFERPSPANFLDFKAQNKVFEDMAFWHYFSYTLLEENGRPEELQAVRVSANLFQMLGSTPRIGRAFDDHEGRDPLVILSDGLWQRRFGGDREALGRTLSLDGVPHTVVGIMAPDFALPRDGVDIWVPQEFDPDQFRFRRYLGVIGRLRPGISIEQADADLDRVAALLAEAHPRSNKGYTASVVPLRTDVIGEAERPLLILFGAVALVLLIACANVAALLLARATRREREVAIRGALGAGRLALVRQLMVESLVLGLIAGAVSLLFAHGALRLLLALEPGNLPRIGEISIDGSVLIFTFALSLLTALFFGLAPALKAARPNLLICLKEGVGQGSSGSWHHHFGLRLLTVAEMALALMLLIGAGLLIKSFTSLQNIDPGFSTEGALTARVALDNQRYPEPEQRKVYFDRLIEQLEALPGVRRAAAVTTLPLSPAGIDFDLPFHGEGRPEVDPNEAPQADFRVATVGYFEALGIPRRAGRTFTDQDREEGQPVVVINETMARQVWPGENAVGKKLTVYYRGRTERLVVGVVADTHHTALGAKLRPQMFIPQAQEPRFSFMNVVVQTEGDALGLLDPVRDTFLAVDSSEPASGLTTMRQLVADSLARERFLTSLLSLMAALALVLAAVGIYGVMAYSVTERTQEIGIRMALGAGGGNVLGLIVRQGATLAAIGIGGGLFGAWMLSSLLSGLLYEIEARDLSTFLGVAILLLLVAIAACSVPAWRAARIDPIRALRHE